MKCVKWSTPSESHAVAKLVKSFGRKDELPKVLTTIATTNGYLNGEAHGDVLRGEVISVKFESIRYFFAPAPAECSIRFDEGKQDIASRGRKISLGGC